MKLQTSHAKTPSSPYSRKRDSRRFSPKKTEKKKKKKKKNGVRRFYGVRRSCRVRGFYSMCTSLAVECDVPCGVRRNYGMRRILSMRGWYRDHIGKFRARTKIPIPKPAQTSRGTPVGSVFPSSPWVRPRGRNWLIFTQPTFKNVTFDNPVLLR